MWPKNPSMEFAIWESCSLLRINPPGIRSDGGPNWDDLDPWTQAKVIAFRDRLEYNKVQEWNAKQPKQAPKTRSPGGRRRR